MSVLIKGMEMPKNCASCRFDDGIFCHAYPESETFMYDIADGIPEWCPLVEVPPHGRLIDADELYDDINESVLLTDCFKDTFNLWFDEQETIIEAEGEEDA